MTCFSSYSQGGLSLRRCCTKFSPEGVTAGKLGDFACAAIADITTFVLSAVMLTSVKPGRNDLQVRIITPNTSAISPESLEMPFS